MQEECLCLDYNILLSKGSHPCPKYKSPRLKRGASKSGLYVAFGINFYCTVDSIFGDNDQLVWGLLDDMGF